MFFAKPSRAHPWAYSRIVPIVYTELKDNKGGKPDDEWVTTY